MFLGSSWVVVSLRADTDVFGHTGCVVLVRQRGSQVEVRAGVLHRIERLLGAKRRVSNRNSVAHYVAERNAIFTAISARFVAHIPLPLVPNLRLKVSFLADQQCGILGAIKVYFPINFIYFDYLTF